VNLRVSRGLTLGLAAFAGLMFLLCVLMWFGFGRGYSWWPLDPADSSAGGKKFFNEQFRLGSWDKYAEVNDRPLFNEDRRPTPPMPPEDGGSGATPLRALDVVLSGVIITPKMRMALVKEKGKEKAMTVKEGGPMPGEWGAWNLVEVKPRSAVFKNSAGESATVELIAVATTQKPTPLPPPPREPVAAAAPPVPAPAQAPPVQQAGEPANAAQVDLQQRIEARRQQIREQQQQQQAPPGQPGEPPQQH
jgi:general secretion pathway protein N